MCWVMQAAWLQYASYLWVHRKHLAQFPSAFEPVLLYLKEPQIMGNEHQNAHIATAHLNMFSIFCDLLQ